MNKNITLFAFEPNFKLKHTCSCKIVINRFSKYLYINPINDDVKLIVPASFNWKFVQIKNYLLISENFEKSDKCIIFFEKESSAQKVYDIINNNNKVKILDNHENNSNDQLEMSVFETYLNSFISQNINSAEITNFIKDILSNLFDSSDNKEELLKQLENEQQQQQQTDFLVEDIKLPPIINIQIDNESSGNILNDNIKIEEASPENYGPTEEVEDTINVKPDPFTIKLAACNKNNRKRRFSNAKFNELVDEQQNANNNIENDDDNHLTQQQTTPKKKCNEKIMEKKKFEKIKKPFIPPLPLKKASNQKEIQARLKFLDVSNEKKRESTKILEAQKMENGWTKHKGGKLSFQMNKYQNDIRKLRCQIITAQKHVDDEPQKDEDKNPKRVDWNKRLKKVQFNLEVMLKRKLIYTALEFVFINNPKILIEATKMKEWDEFNMVGSNIKFKSEEFQTFALALNRLANGRYQKEAFLTEFSTKVLQNQEEYEKTFAFISALKFIK